MKLLPFWVFIFLNICLIPSYAFAFDDVITHPLITKAVIDRSNVTTRVAAFVGYSSGFNTFLIGNDRNSDHELFGRKMDSGRLD